MNLKASIDSLVLNISAFISQFGSLSGAVAQAPNSATSAATSAASAAAVVTGGTASLTPAAGKIPLADAGGKIDRRWMVDNGLAARALSRAVHLTKAASGSSGITVPNNANNEVGAKSFTLHFEGSQPSWTAVTDHFLMLKHVATTWASYWSLSLPSSGSGKLVVGLNGSTLNAAIQTAAALPLIGGAVHKITAVVVRETAAVDGSVSFYVDGLLFEVVVIDHTQAGAGESLAVAGDMYILGDKVSRVAGAVQSALLYNRALTASEVLALCQSGCDPRHRRSSQTSLTSGALVVGQEYIVDTYVAGDDFANVGGSNVTGAVFVATGTTPTAWTNSSSLRASGAVLIYEPDGIQPTGQILDTSGNNMHATMPAAGWSLSRTKDEGMYVAYAVAADTTFSVPAGYLLERLVIENNTATPVTLRLGTTANGTELAADTVMTGSTFSTLSINKMFSRTAATPVYLYRDTAAAWESNVDYVAYVRRVP